jgi:hypothetical protein
LRFEVIRFIKEYRVDFFQPHKLDDFNALRRLDIRAPEVFVLEHDEFSLFVFVPFNYVFPRHLLAVHLRHALIIDGTQIRLAQQLKFQLFPLGRRIQRDRYVDQAEVDRSFPDGSHLPP